MTEDAREYITNNFCGKDSSIDEVIEFFRPANGRLDAPATFRRVKKMRRIKQNDRCS